MAITQNHVINIQPGVSAPLVIHCSQGDTGSVINLTVVNGDETFDCSSYACSVHGVRSDGANWGPFLVTVSGSTVSFSLRQEMTMIAGPCLAEITIGTVGTANFAILVENATFSLGVTYTEDVSIYQSILNYNMDAVQNIKAETTAGVNKAIDQMNANTNAINAKYDAAIDQMNANTNAINAKYDTATNNFNQAIATTQNQYAVTNAKLDTAISAVTQDSEVQDVRVKADGTSATTAGNAVREQFTELKNDLNNVGEYAINTIVKEIRYPLLPFEMGAINITTSGWTYADNPKRIRTPEGKEIWLDAGDMISLTDYTNARFFLGVRQKDGTYLSASWKTADFTVTYKGWYVLLVARINNEVALSSVAELADLVRITKVSTLQEVVQSDTKKIASIGAGMIPLSKNLTDAEVPFERGTITINNPPTTITYANSDRSVRIPESVGGIPLKAGDTIGLTDYSAAKYELFYYADGVYVSLSTNIADKIVPVDGVYYIIIHELNNAVISNVSTYASLFFVNRADDISNVVDTMKESLSYIQYPYDIYPIHGINHRGMQYEAPENTLPAFRLSVKAGYHFVETDVQFTSDNVPVLLHDPTINRTARNIDGTVLSETVYIKNITYAEALEYDFPVVNGVYDSSFAGTKIFKFEDFIVFCKRTELFPYLELKSETTYTQEQVNILIALLDQYKMLRNVSWISWSDEFLGMIVKADKGARVGRIKNSKIDGASVNALNKFKTGFNRVFWSFSPYENDTWKLTEQSIINAKNAGQGLSIGVISTKEGMLNVLNHFENSGYISGCLSNERVNFAEVVKDIALGID